MEPMPERDPVNKKMWALRLGEKHREMLKEAAAFSKANKTEFLEWLIEEYHKSVIQRKGSAGAAKKKKPSK